MYEILADVFLHTVETVIKAITEITLVGNKLIFIHKQPLKACNAQLAVVGTLED